MKNHSRVRLKGGGIFPVEGAAYYTWPSNEFDPHPNPVGWHVSSTRPYKMLRYMVDTVGYLKDDFNPCYHDKYAGFYKFPSYYAVVDANNDTHSVSYTWEPGLLDPISDCRQLDIPLGSWIEDFSARAENHFLTLVGVEYSPINFIIETIQLLEGNVKILEKLRKQISEAFSRFWAKLRDTGNYWLSWNFGIKPVISDVKSALSIYSRALKRLKWLRTRNHKDTKVHYREGPREFEWTNVFTLAPIVNTEPHHFEPDPGPGPLYFDWADWILIDRRATADCWAQVRLSAWAWIRFDIDDAFLEGMEGLGIVMSAMSGLYNPLQIAWDAIPYTWLIDWFRTEAHKLRETLKSDLNPFGVATIKEAGWSMKCRVLGKYFSEVRGLDLQNGGNPLSDYQRTEAGAFRYQVFCRQPKLPIVGDWPFTVPWKWYNNSILLALIDQKTRRN